MKKILSLLAAFFLLSAVALHADEFTDAKQRIQARQGEVAALKANGTLGENNRGLLEVRANAANADKIAADENHDREILYGAIARRTGGTVDAVGRARAREIAQRSGPGIWLQDESGKWSRK